jgi:hypothetical protein
MSRYKPRVGDAIFIMQDNASSSDIEVAEDEPWLAVFLRLFVNDTSIKPGKLYWTVSHITVEEMFNNIDRYTGQN